MVILTLVFIIFTVLNITCFMLLKNISPVKFVANAVLVSLSNYFFSYILNHIVNVVIYTLNIIFFFIYSK